MNGPLLDELAKHFVESRFSLKALVRLITRGRINIPRLPAQRMRRTICISQSDSCSLYKLSNCSTQLCRSPARKRKFDGYPKEHVPARWRAAQERRSKEGGGRRALPQSLRQAGTAADLQCERSENMGLVQAFQLLTGRCCKRCWWIAIIGLVNG